MNDTITISRKEYADLRADSDFLNALHELGVDNWEGYSEAASTLDDDED